MQRESSTTVSTIEVGDRDMCDVLHWFDIGLVDVDTPHWLPLGSHEDQPAPIARPRRGVRHERRWSRSIAHA
jgi:hypothetical protein